jgi:IMP dehydrogenase/GMP reductase
MNMKKIYYTKGNGLIVGKFYIPKDGILYTSEMENDQRIKDLIRKGLLVIKEEEVEVKSEKEQPIRANAKNEDAVASKPPEETEKPEVFSEPNHAIPFVGNQDTPIVTDTPSVVAASVENPVVKEVKPVEVVVEQDLGDLKKELENLTEPEIKTPVQKKS